MEKLPTVLSMDAAMLMVGCRTCLKIFQRSGSGIGMDFLLQFWLCWAGLKHILCFSAHLVFGKPYSKRKKSKYWKQKLKLKIETQKNTFVYICVYVWIDMYMFMVEQYKNNSISWRSDPGLLKCARCNESAGRSHMGSWKLPTPPCIFLSFYHMKHCARKRM